MLTIASLNDSKVKIFRKNNASFTVSKNTMEIMGVNAFVKCCVIKESRSKNTKLAAF